MFTYLSFIFEILVVTAFSELEVVATMQLIKESEFTFLYYIYYLCNRQKKSRIGATHVFEKKKGKPDT